jgi:hypothetical protein
MRNLSRNRRNQISFKVCQLEKRILKRYGMLKILGTFVFLQNMPEHMRNIIKGALCIQPKIIMLTLSMRLETLGECVISKMVNISDINVQGILSVVSCCGTLL